MTESQRSVLELFGEIWSRSPDVRLGQLMAHLGFLGEVDLDRNLGEIEDDEMMDVMKRHLSELVQREPHSTSAIRNGIPKLQFETDLSRKSSGF
jgi:uncharacterized protein YihD (DUF1040 family)